MAFLLSIGALVFSVVLVLFLARRAVTLFELTAEGGRVVRVKGRIPPEMLGDLEDVFRRASATGQLSVRIEDGRPTVHALGLDDGTTQRVRNVVGRFPLARIKAANPLD